MDRHVEFASHLSHLIALYACDPVDHAAERAVLRAARGAAKHGDIDVFLEDGALRAGHQAAETDQPDVMALQSLFGTLGLTRIGVVHQAKQEEIKRLARLLGEAAAGDLDSDAFGHEVSKHSWTQVSLEFATVGASGAVDSAASGSPVFAVDGEAGEAGESETAGGLPLPAPSVETPELVAGASAPDAALPAVTEPSTAAAAAEGVDVATPVADALPLETTGTPLADELPAEVAALAGPVHKELFERLITSSEPSTLRLLLEPVQQAIELAARSGAVAESVHLLQAMFACEACATVEEMHRQFVVTLRRLTTPTLVRAFASLYLDAPEEGAAVEQVLARFGEDGSEAVFDRAACAADGAARTAYVALLQRLPGTPDALLAMLDDDRDSVVERAIALLGQFGHPDLERALGVQLSHASVRVRQAAARALAALTTSEFAADALIRAAQDASADVRLIAAVALQARREVRLASAIVPLIDDEEELDVQLALVTALGRLVASEGVQKLIAIASTDARSRRGYTRALRLAAIEALGEARTPAAMVALQKLLEDREKDVREAAARLYTRARRQTAAVGVHAITES